MIRAALLGALAVVLGSCSVNEYCLNCEKGDAGHGDDSGDHMDGNGSGSGSGSDGGGPCIPSGVEICDGLDNDCNGQIDDNIADIGMPCANQVGECAGGKITCTAGHPGCTKPPMPELCDMKDNNCNGMIDEGDPGGGAACGTNVGECTAGVKHCDPVTGTVKCYGNIGTVGGQPELCNGKDDDCDGSFDEGIGSLGTCGGAPGANPNVGLCHSGMKMCSGGGQTCMGDQGPVFEVCDNADNDCDGVIDNGFDKKHDPQNCGACGHVCSAAHATSGCAPTGPMPAGACNIASCATGFHDLNNMPGDGCEYACLADGAEVCDGVDNDCDGKTDTANPDLTPPVGLCKTAGACTGSFAMCTGAGGWKCVYPSGNVSLDAMGNIVPETVCDGIDNDCDGIKDNAQPNLGDACHDAGIGECQSSGVFICNPTAPHTGPAVCDKSTHVGVASSPEKCDGKDNDCDGLIDDGAAAGTLPGQEWVAIPNSAVKIMKYEASRPDASGTDQGITNATTCSRPGVIPWTNVKYPDAVTACTNVGGRLCTEAEWQQMCEGIETYPQSAPTGSDLLIIQAEDAQTFTANTSGGTSRSWTFASGFAGTTGRGDVQALPDTGAAPNAASAPTQSPRMDFPINFGAVAADYYIYVRMYGVDGNGDSVYVGINATTPGTANATRLNATDGEWSWVRSALFTGVTGTQTVSVYMREDGTRVDAIAIAQVAAQIPNDSQTWSYKTNHHLPQPQTCNSNEFDTDAGTAGDQDDVIATGARAACYADGGGVNDAFDMSGNVKEWTKARAAQQNPIRGGSSNNDVSGTTCELDFTLADDAFFFPNVGFRCCK